MARNVDYGQENEFIPFNCYKSVRNEKGRLVMETKPYERIYCRIESERKGRSNVANMIRQSNSDVTFVTKSQNKLEVDWYIQNVYTKELWRVNSITKLAINEMTLQNSLRPQYEYRLECVK